MGQNRRFLRESDSAEVSLLDGEEDQAMRDEIGRLASPTDGVCNAIDQLTSAKRGPGAAPYHEPIWQCEGIQGGPMFASASFPRSGERASLFARGMQLHLP